MRPAAPGDAAAIRSVHLAAFPSGAEAELVVQLERDRDAVLSLVAERDERIVGHVMMSRMAVEGDGRRYRALGLAPLAVAPAEQGTGVGTALAAGALAGAGAAGEELVFVLGEPDYYERFGFSAATAQPFASPYAGPHFLAALLAPVDLPGSGRADYAPAFSRLG